MSSRPLPQQILAARKEPHPLTPLVSRSYPTELFPYSLRSKGITCELLSIYGSLIIVAFVNPIGMDNIGWRYYIVYCCLLAVFLAVTFALFPETKGHSLEEIAELFDGPGVVPDVKKVEQAKADVQAEHIEVAA